MNYKYRVKGVVEKPFVLTGVFFRIGVSIDLHIAKNNLEFVKERCKIKEIIDLQKFAETPKPIQSTTQIKAQSIQKAVKNELPRTNGTNKDKN